jgi:hypothetical protein
MGNDDIEGEYLTIGARPLKGQWLSGSGDRSCIPQNELYRPKIQRCMFDSIYMSVHYIPVDSQRNPRGT